MACTVCPYSCIWIRGGRPLFGGALFGTIYRRAYFALTVIEGPSADQISYSPYSTSKYRAGARHIEAAARQRETDHPQYGPYPLPLYILWTRDLIKRDVNRILVVT